MNLHIPGNAAEQPAIRVAAVRTFRQAGFTNVYLEAETSGRFCTRHYKVVLESCRSAGAMGRVLCSACFENECEAADDLELVGAFREAREHCPQGHARSSDDGHNCSVRTKPRPPVFLAT
jgi:hypothetical protein